MSMNKKVLGVCSKCGNTGVMPNIGGMVASECELCSMDYETLEKTRGTNIADFSAFLGSVAKFKEALSEGHIYALISSIIHGKETSEIVIGDFRMVAVKLNNGQIDISIFTEIYGQDSLVHELRTRVWGKDGVLISRNRVLERTLKKVLSWEPGYVHLSLITALSVAYDLQTQNMEEKIAEELNNESSGSPNIFTSMSTWFCNAIGLNR